MQRKYDGKKAVDIEKKETIDTSACQMFLDDLLDQY